MLRNVGVTPLVLCCLLLIGCPPPAKTGAQGGKSGSKSDAESKTTPTGEGASDGDGPKGGGVSAAKGTVTKLFPKELMEDKHFYPPLKDLHEWPDPVGLTPMSEVPAEKKPKAIRSRLLKELVELVVHKDLRPKDVDASLGVDAKGRVFAKLGKGKTEGSASIETRSAQSNYPVFAITIESPAKGPHTIESLRARIKSVLVPGLIEEMQTKDAALLASPRVKGDERAAGMAMLNRQGAFGMQFNYVYAYGDDERVVVLLQEVPHMKLDGLPGGK